VLEEKDGKKFQSYLVSTEVGRALEPECRCFFTLKPTPEIQHIQFLYKPNKKACQILHTIDRKLISLYDVKLRKSGTKIITSTSLKYTICKDYVWVQYDLNKGLLYLLKKTKQELDNESKSFMPAFPHLKQYSCNLSCLDENCNILWEYPLKLGLVEAIGGCFYSELTWGRDYRAKPGFERYFRIVELPHVCAHSSFYFSGWNLIFWNISNLFM
jgi:hypothetical protein